MRLISYDCEVFAYDWLVTLKDKETGVYTCIWNDNEALKMALSDDCIYVGFNSKHYDQYIIKAIAAGFAPEEIKKVNDFIIAGGQGWQCPLLDGIYFRFSNVDIRDDQSAITFKPQFTLWLSCNDLPMVTDKSLFASERIKVVEFNRHFSPEEQDTHLKDELCEQSSMSGIFMWLVRGYIHYKERGLAMSGSLKSVVTKYERDNDLVLQFLENRCERVPEESSPTVIKAKDLYNSFKIWAKSEGAYILSARKFNSEMERHPEWFDRKSTSSGYATYCGLKLKEVL